MVVDDSTCLADSQNIVNESRRAGATGLSIYTIGFFIQQREIIEVFPVIEGVLFRSLRCSITLSLSQSYQFLLHGLELKLITRLGVVLTPKGRKQFVPIRF